MGRHRSGYVTIYLDEHIDEISDDDLIEEMRIRKLTLTPSVPVIEPDIMELVMEAHTELLNGRSAEALLILERLASPKWKAAAEALSAYQTLRQ